VGWPATANAQTRSRPSNWPHRPSSFSCASVGGTSLCKCVSAFKKELHCLLHSRQRIHTWVLDFGLGFGYVLRLVTAHEQTVGQQVRDTMGRSPCTPIRCSFRRVFNTHQYSLHELINLRCLCHCIILDLLRLCTDLPAAPALRACSKCCTAGPCSTCRTLCCHNCTVHPVSAWQGSLPRAPCPAAPLP
jgi:hypothetical protein